jgi:hypothetical protein
MAEIIEWTDDQWREWAEWVAECPEVIQEMCRRLPPNRLYRLGHDGHWCTVISYCEDGTVSVGVELCYNEAVFLDREVFGIDPEELEECELPDTKKESPAAAGTQQSLSDLILSRAADEPGEPLSFKLLDELLELVGLPAEGGPSATLPTPYQPPQKHRGSP